ncbi:FHA domain-containing protein [Pseudonocardia sp. GCM10023141]|uniref:FHA domain-containing protein n=1 Tax=Pseudonocardia sp. GCM10023141 TaxID=3252653 RepID=UPI0036D327A3
MREAVTIGRSASCDAVILDDTSVSRLHATTELLAGKWCLRDLGSTNGTYVNGRAILVQTPLDTGDEIRVGKTLIIVHIAQSSDDASRTDCPASPPLLTTREYDVLQSLLRPVITGGDVNEVASPREIALALGVTAAAVRQHFVNLYRKFDIGGRGTGRQARLAHEAIRRGSLNALDMHTIRHSPEPPHKS